MGKNLFVAEGYSLIDEERREGGMKNRSKWNLNTLLAERSTKERNMRAKTKSGSQDGLKSAVHSTLCVSVGGEIRLNLLQNIVSFLSYQCNTKQKVRHFCQLTDLVFQITSPAHNTQETQKRKFTIHFMPLDQLMNDPPLSYSKMWTQCVAAFVGICGKNGLKLRR